MSIDPPTAEMAVRVARARWAWQFMVTSVLLWVKLSVKPTLLHSVTRMFAAIVMVSTALLGSGSTMVMASTYEIA